MSRLSNINSSFDSICHGCFFLHSKEQIFFDIDGMYSPWHAHIMFFNRFYSVTNFLLREYKDISYLLNHYINELVINFQNKPVLIFFTPRDNLFDAGGMNTSWHVHSLFVEPFYTIILFCAGVYKDISCLLNELVINFNTYQY